MDSCKFPCKTHIIYFFHCLSCFCTIFYSKTTQKSTETCNNMAKDTSVKDTVSQSKLLAVKLSLALLWSSYYTILNGVAKSYGSDTKKLYVSKKKGTRIREISDVNGIITL